MSAAAKRLPRYTADEWRAWAVTYLASAAARARVGNDRAAKSNRAAADHCFDKANEAALNFDLRAAP